MRRFSITRNFLLASVAALTLHLFSEDTLAMGLIGFKVCIASEMKAKVTSAGKPVAGASVVRKVIFDGKDYVTEVKTDSEGIFFCRLFMSALSGKIPRLNFASRKMFILITRALHTWVYISFAAILMKTAS